LAQALGTDTIPAPTWLFWRLRKRARLAGRVRSANGVADEALPRIALAHAAARFWHRRHGRHCRGRRLVIVDDVVTTGHTLRVTAAAALSYSHPTEVAFATLASAL
jgi:predicted amidophosphoribosyltransferase